MTQSHSSEHARTSDKLKNWGSVPAPFVDSMIDMQKQALECVAELNQVWTIRAQSESKLVTDLVGKLAAAKSIPDAASAWQECIKRQFQLNAEDAQRLLEQSERYMRLSAELFSNGRGGIAT